jgi:hypothetical protein
METPGVKQGSEEGAKGEGSEYVHRGGRWCRGGRVMALVAVSPFPPSHLL